MSLGHIDDLERLKKINAALINRVERSMDRQGNAFSLFQTAINLESLVRSRTDELHSALRRLEQSNAELIEARDRAEQANISKTRFLAAASHDVLQPLNAAHLSVSALADVQTSAEGRRLVRQVERSLETMETLLRTLLDISRLDAGVVEPDLTSVPLDQLFQGLRSDFLPLAERKGLKLRFAPTLWTIRTDRTLIRRILQNIVANAIRYTTEGGVLVGVRRRGENIRIEVADTGSGIAEDQRDAIFEEFHRGVAVDESGLSGAGLGLGLAIVRRMVETLGYRVSLDSRIGKGTVFHLDIPGAMIAPLESTPNPVEPEQHRGYGLFGTKVLLVENDPDVASAMSTLLESWKCEVRVAATTEEALAELNDTAWIPDIVIADQHLDRGDLGSATIMGIRAWLGRVVPALVTTADPSAELQEEVAEMGVELLVKPIRPARLRALLAHMLA
ncbi:MAG: hybrid sensor histidine kinase/response regulator [Rhizobiaceae bacterium]|nr:hybrid sensor histidine kinase/response regulator [Rhizobiaceae bacterium]